MTGPSSTSAQQGGTGRCRDARRASGGRRAGWVRPFRRLHAALDASQRLIDSTLQTVAVSERCAQRRPIGASRKLDDASGLLVTASTRLSQAATALARLRAHFASHPESAAGAPAILLEAAGRFVYVTGSLGVAADRLFGLQDDLFDGLRSGELVPERLSEQGRRRIVLAPRPTPVRAFLRARQPRVIDRISSVLKRRRRTRRPAAVSVPRRTWQGRAPPSFPICLV